jgi:hypothetical protein
MIRALFAKFVKLLRLCKSEMATTVDDGVPDTIDDDECLVRNVYTPWHVEKKSSGWILREAAFIPPRKQKDPLLFSNEISTLRALYTHAQFCKDHGQTISGGRDQIGFAVMRVGHIRALHPLVKEVLATKLMNRTPPLPMHADIIYNFTPEEDQPIPGDIKKVFKQIARTQACFYLDPNPTEALWSGPEILVFPCTVCVRCQKEARAL